MRWTLIGGALCAVLLVAFGMFLPAWLSSDSGRTWLLGRINDSIPGRLAASGLKLNWTEGQTLESLRLEDAAGGTIAHLRLLTADVTLAQILRGEFGTGRILIEGLVLDLTLDDEGRLNLVGAIAAATEDDEESEPIDLPKLLRDLVVELPASLKADIELRDARVSLSGPAMEKPLQFTDVAGTLRLEKIGAPIDFELTGTLDQQTASLKARLDGFDPQGRLRASGAKLDLSIDVDLAEGTGAIEASVGKLRQWLGSKVHLGVAVQTSKSGATFLIDAKSPRFTLKAPGGFEVSKGEPTRLRVEKARLQYDLTPAQLRAVAAGETDVALAGDVRLSVDVATLDMPLGGSVNELDARAAIADGRVDVMIAGVAESLGWKGWSASVRKDAAAERATLAVHGRIAEGVVAIEGLARSASDAQLQASIKNLPLARMDRVVESFTGRRGLLVDALGPQLNLEGNIRSEGRNRRHIDLSIDAKRLKLAAPLVVDLEHKTFHAENVVLDYTMAPGLVPALGLDQDLPLRLDIASFTGKLTGFDPGAMSVQAKLTVGAARMRGAEAIELKGANVEIDSESLARGLSVSAECRIDEGRVGLGGNLADLWDESGRLQLANARGRVRLDIERLAVGRFDPALGQVLNGHLTLDGKGDDAKLDVGLRSEVLNLVLAMLVSNNRVRLREPGRVSYSLTPKIASRFLAGPDDASGPSPRLREPVEVVLDLQAFEGPADGTFSLEDASARAVISLGPVHVDDVPKAGTVSLKDTSLKLDGKSLAVAKFTAETSLTSSRVSLGAPVSVKAAGDRNSVKLGMKAADRLALALAVDLDDESYKLREPARLDLDVRPDLLRQLGVPHEWLRGPLKVSAVIDSLRMPRAGDWRDGEASVQLTVPEARVHIEDRDVTLRDLSLKGGLAKKVTAILSGKLGDGDLNVEATASAPSADAAIVLSARAVSFPTGLLGDIGPACVGSTADLTAKANMPEGWRAGRGDASLVVESELLELTAQIVGDGQWRLAKPATLKWTLTPDALRKLSPNSKTRLAAPAVLQVAVNHFSLAAEAESPTDAVLRARAQIPELRLRGDKDQEFVVRALELDVSSDGVRKPVTIGLDGSLEGGAKPGRVHGKLVVTYLGEKGEPVVFEEQQLEVQADLFVEELPVQKFDAVMNLDGYMWAVLGDSASGKFKAHITRGRGPVGFELSSGNLDGTIAAKLRPRFVVLDKPIRAKLRHSKALGDKVLPKLGPLFQGIVATEAPIRFLIKKKGFRIPREFELAKVRVPYAMLDLGKVTMENQQLVRVIQQLAGSKLPDKTVGWFTPVEVSLKKGKVEYLRRLDVQLEHRYHFSTWGSADLVKERVDMTLGVMPDTLREILKIKGVDSADTLRIDVRGPLANPKIDTGRAVASLAAIRAKDEALRNLPAFARKLAGNALGKLLRNTFEGPPPLDATADPLPWKKEKRKR